MTDGSWWRQVWLAFIARGPYDPSGRDQEIARLRSEVAGRDSNRFRQDILAIRRWCIDISREATARDLDDLRVVMPAILDELDRALAGESLAHAQLAGPGDAEVINTELTPVIDELRRGAGR